MRPLKTPVHVLLAAFLLLQCSCAAGEREKHLRELRSGNVSVMKNAIYLLGAAKTKQAVPALVPLVKSDQPKEIRVIAAWALGSVGQRGPATEALIACLEGEDGEVRIAAIEALGKLKDPRAIAPLSAVTGGDTAGLTAIWALGRIGNTNAVAGLSKLLKDQDPYVRYAASQSLKQIGM